MNINERIKKRRIDLGLTLRDVAEQLGVAESTVSRYESTDIKNMGIDKLAALAEVLHVSPGYIMGWEIENNSISSFTKNYVLGKMELLNHEGQQRVADYADDLVDSGKYTLKDSKGDRQVDTDISFVDEEPLPYVADAGFKITQEERKLLKDLANRIKDEDV